MIAMTQPSEEELFTGEAVALDVRPASFLLRSVGGAIDFLASVMRAIGDSLTRRAVDDDTTGAQASS